MPATLPPLAVFHFSLTVSDIERSVRWYRDVLGLELVHRQRQDNPYTRKLVGFAGAVLEVAQFRIEAEPPRLSTHFLELVQYLSPAARHLHAQPNQPGAPHICFVVSDIDAKYEQLQAAGVRFRSPPVAITAGVNRGGKGCYFEDPDGITLELHQPPPGLLEAQALPN